MRSGVSASGVANVACSDTLSGQSRALLAWPMFPQNEHVVLESFGRPAGAVTAATSTWSVRERFLGGFGPSDAARSLNHLGAYMKELPATRLICQSCRRCWSSRSCFRSCNFTCLDAMSHKNVFDKQSCRLCAVNSSLTRCVQHENNCFGYCCQCVCSGSAAP